MNIHQEEIEKNVKDFLAVMRTPGYCADREENMLKALTSEVIRELAAHPKKWASLGKVADHFRGVHEIEFYERVGKLHTELPPLELLDVVCRRMLSPACRQRLLYVLDKRELTRYAGSSFLIDLACLQEIICQQKEKGWQFLRYCGENGRRCQTLKMPEALSRAIEDDAPATFAITMDMTGTQLSYSLLMQILKAEKFQIFRDLLTRHAIPDRVASTADLCVLFVTGWNSKKAIELLKLLEECRPGAVKDFCDPFGRNLLWYAVRNPDCIWFHPEEPLVQYLLEQGCDVDNCNTLGLSWRFVVENLSQKMRKKLWLGYRQMVRALYPAARLRYEPPKGKNAAVWTVSHWDRAATPDKNMSLGRVLMLCKNDKQNLLADQLHEAYFHYRYLPELTLPESWQDQLADAGTFHVLKTPLSASDLAIMKSYHHPLADYPTGGHWGTRLVSIPMKPKGIRRWNSEMEHALTVLKTGLLVYHPLVKEYYCRNRYDGWEILRHHGCAAAPAAESYPLRERFLPLIEQDQVPGFALLYGLAGVNCPPGMLDDLMRNGAGSILQWLRKERDEFNELYPREELLFYAVSHLPDKTAVRILTALDDGYGLGLLRDSFGSNLMWYALFNPQRQGFFCDSRLFGMLKNKGCRLTDTSKFGICPQDIVDVEMKKEVIRQERERKKSQA